MKTFIIPTTLMLLLTALFLGCNDDDSSSEPQPTIRLRTDATLGSFLVDQEGRTLYIFSSDVDGNSACAGGCLDRWPVFNSDEIILGDGLDEADFGTIQGNDGPQITFKGWPLYYFAPGADGVIEESDQTQGEGFGNVWYVAKDYSLMIARQEVMPGEGAELHLVDIMGNTLYRFTVDEPGISNCSGSCITAWPVFSYPDELIIPSTLSSADFAVISRTDDERDQLSYQGSPLYYFAQDNSRGDTNGEGVNNVWFVVNPSL
jgi:predicted lipoprotein with Yx(FWY)xxD motif